MASNQAAPPVTVKSLEDKLGDLCVMLSKERKLPSIEVRSLDPIPVAISQVFRYQSRYVALYDPDPCLPAWRSVQLIKQEMDDAGEVPSVYFFVTPIELVALLITGGLSHRLPRDIEPWKASLWVKAAGFRFIEYC